MEEKCWDAYISYFYSFKHFYTINIIDQVTINEISKSLQLLKKDKILTLSDVKFGDLVAVEDPKDGLWYRAKVLNTMKNAFKVKFIDYGNVEISSNCIKLPEKLASYHAMAHHCILDDVEDEEHIITNNNEIYDVVLEFMTSIEVILNFLSKKEPYVVNMMWDGRNIKTHLNNIISFGINLNTYKTLRTHEQLGKKMQVNLTYTSSIEEFYVEFEESEEIRKKIEYELENGTIWTPVTDIKFGKLVIARSFTDNRWYRVRIMEKCENNKYICYFIDYGIKECCSEFYEAIDYLESAPPFIKRCTLHMPNFSKNMLGYLSVSFIDEMKHSKDLKMNITVLKTGEPCLVELEIDNLSVVEIIKPRPVIVFQVLSLNALTVQINTVGRRNVLSELKKLRHENLHSVKKPIINEMYGVNLNNEWYRVKLKSTISMEVIFVDMGGIKRKVNQLFFLPAHIKRVEYLTVYCSLNLDSTKYCVGKLRKINESVEEFVMIILQNNVTGGHYIRLFLNDKDVVEMIKKC